MLSQLLTEALSTVPSGYGELFARGCSITYLRSARTLVGLCGDPFALLPGSDANTLGDLGWLHAGSA